MQNLLLTQFDRLSYTYKIITKKGESVDFRPNWAQLELLRDREHRNLVLKCRQIGSTTFWSLYLLDIALFHPNSFCGIIADKMDTAKDIFRRVIKHSVDNLHPWVKQINPVVADNSTEIRFANGSGIRVGTSMRGGTLTGGLLVSEFGKICAESPDVAREIVNGSIEAVPVSAITIIESTSEGRGGNFFDMWQRYENKPVLSKSDYKTFFFPWWKEPTYIDPVPIALTQTQSEYFRRLEEKIKVKLTDPQKWWYVRKEADKQDSMRQEYPSTSEEAWEGSHEGFYYSAIISKIRHMNHITKVPYNKSKKVHTSFDIGLDDHTSVWFFQFGEAGTLNIIDYKEWQDVGGNEIAVEMNRLGYNYGTHIMPHDSRKRDEFTAISYANQMQEVINGTIYELQIGSILAGIQQVRLTLPMCYFDEEKCDQGLKRLSAYKKEWDDRLGTFRQTPLHNDASHCADSFRYLSVGYQFCDETSEVTPEWLAQTRQSLGYKP